HIRLDLLTVPLASVLLLLAAGAFDARTLRDGVLGTRGIAPLNIMALFLSLAYLSISLDATGLFRFLAFWVARRGGADGRRLFAYLYLFFLLSGVVVGNDPVILSGTAFLAYFTRVAGITPPTAWIFAQFAAANMASVVLVSSNPTNLVLAGAFRLSFLAYAAHVALPFLAAALAVLPLLLHMFRAPALVPPRIDVALAPAEVRATLVDARGAACGGALLLATLGVLVGTSTVGVPVWEVTVPPALLMLVRDAWHDWSAGRGKRKADSNRTAIGHLPTDAEGARTDALTAALRLRARLAHAFPTVAHVAARLPVALVPFALLMFVLVQGLAAQGWVALFARAWAAWAARTGPLGAVGGMALLSCVLCNFCGTNIGATILLARVLQLWAFPADAGPPAADPRTRDGAVYALALGSNFGAFTLTFSASLAGLLWRAILGQKGIRVRARQFLALNAPISLVAMLVASAVLVGEVYVEHR
ncbi:hypothetical protein C8Q80DRAFT_1097430, partial [Daedaleopsis nitida]